MICCYQGISLTQTTAVSAFCLRSWRENREQTVQSVRVRSSPFPPEHQLAHFSCLHWMFTYHNVSVSPAHILHILPAIRFRLTFKINLRQNTTVIYTLSAAECQQEEKTHYWTATGNPLFLIFNCFEQQVTVKRMPRLNRGQKKCRIKLCKRVIHAWRKRKNKSWQ